MYRTLLRLYRFLAITALFFTCLVFFYYLIGSYQVFVPATQRFLLTLMVVGSTITLWSGANLLAYALLQQVLRVKYPPLDYLWSFISLLGGVVLGLIARFILRIIH